MRPLFITVILLAATSGFAQNPQGIVSTDPNSVHFDPRVGCPINVWAQRQSNLAILSAKDDRKDGTALGLHVMLKPISTPNIESVEVTLHGTSSDPRVLPVGPASPSDVTKTFELHRKADEQSLADFDLWMHHAGSLRWADITVITYSDGTSWHPSKTSICRAVPSSLTLIGQR
jgi:hypothetical protein